MTFARAHAGTAVTTNAMSVRLNGFVKMVRLPRSPFGNVLNKSHNATPQINGQSENGSELDDDCVHFPEAILQIDMQQRLADAQVCGGTHRKKFGQSFDDPEQDGKQIVVHFDLKFTRHCHVERSKESRIIRIDQV